MNVYAEMRTGHTILDTNLWYRSVAEIGINQFE